MSLIKCPECGKMISEYAPHCINCGCPMDKIRALSKPQKTEKIKKSVHSTTKNKNIVRQDRVVRSSFLYSRDEIEQKFIADVVKCVQNSIENSIGKDHPYKYSIRIKLGEENYKTLGWFRADENNKMIFRYYTNPNEKGETEEFVARTKISEEVAGILIKICRNQISPPEDTKEANKVSDEFYEALVASIQGRKRIKCSNKQKEIIFEITRFVLDDVCANAIADKVFKNKDDFEQHKRIYHFTPTFFGNAFSFRNITKRVADMFIAYFISAQILSKIKQYEKLYNEIIISNYSQVIVDYAQMYLRNNNINYCNSSGIISNIKLVPNTTLDEIVNNIVAQFSNKANLIKIKKIVMR